VVSGVDSGSRVVAGRYRLIEPLGTGGMGTVWRAEDTVLGREVAVKEVTFPHGLSDEDREVLRERTRREARAAARLDHPSAVTVYDVVEEDGAPYLVMEYVDARTLADVVRSDGPLSPQRTAEVGLALLGALEAAHAQGIVHRDVKPGNVMLTPARQGRPGRVVLADFGIATSTGDSSITSTGLLLGSPSYIAPERARGQAPGPASDLWSLGATLFTAVEGRPPYDGGEPLLTVTAVVTGDHAPFVSAGPLEPVLEGLLERDPAARLSAADARRLLEDVHAHATAADARPGARPATSPTRAGAAERTAALAVGPARSAVGPRALPKPKKQPKRKRRPAPVPAPALDGPSGDRSSRPSGRVTRVLIGALGLLFVLAVGGIGYVIATTGDSGFDADGTAAPSPAGDSDQPDASPEPEQPTPALPVGWTSYTHPEEGWTAAVPPGYERSERNGLTQFRNDDTRRTLRIGYTDDPPASALQDWQRLSTTLESQLTDYREVNVREIDYRGYDAADLEFTYRDSGADLRVLDRGFVVDGPDGAEAFFLYWQTNESDFDESLALFEQMAELFQPNGAVASSKATAEDSAASDG
jgi:tRNA A-37 threonylcarbamoyl transferase component Bud32